MSNSQKQENENVEQVSTSKEQQALQSDALLESYRIRMNALKKEGSMNMSAFETERGNANRERRIKVLRMRKDIQAMELLIEKAEDECGQRIMQAKMKYRRQCEDLTDRKQDVRQWYMLQIASMR